MAQFKNRHYRGVSEALHEAYQKAMTEEEAEAINTTAQVLALMFREDKEAFSVDNFNKACTTGEFSYAPPSNS